MLTKKGDKRFSPPLLSLRIPRWRGSVYPVLQNQEEEVRVMPRQKTFQTIFYGLLLFTVIVGPGLAQAACLTDATPIGFWPLEVAVGTGSDKTFEDISATANDAECSGTDCPTQAAGQINFGQSFPNANHVVTVPANAAYDFSGSFTVELWTSRSSLPGGNEVIIGRDDASTSLAWWVGLNDRGNVAFSLRDTDSVSNSITGYSNIADGNMHHIVAVHDNDAGKNLLYVDGVLEVSADVAYTGSFASTADLTFGANDLSNGYNYDGVIDEVALYNNAFEAIQVRLHYQNGDLGSAYCDAVAAQLVADTTEAALGAEIFWTVNAAGNPEPAFSLGSNAPDTMDIGASTGEISWIPMDTETGNTTFDVTADNGTSDTASFSINVLDMCTAANLAGFWPLEVAVGTGSDKTFADSSATANDAECSGTDCPTQAGGQVGFGQSFPNANHVITVPADTAYDFSGSFAVELWMSRSAVPGSLEVMISRDDASTSLAWWVGINYDAVDTWKNGKAAFSLRDTNGVSQAITGVSNVADGNLHHIVAVHDNAANQNRLYVDGVLEAIADVTYTGSFASTADLTIGANDTSNSYNYDGIIDEVAIYNRTLTDTMAMQHAMLAQSYCNTAPVITSTAPDSATEDQELTHPFTATDTTDGDTSFTWTLSNAPSGMSVDASTGELTWTPGDVADSGNVTVTVMDSVGGTATQDFTITVTNVNDDPVISTTAPTTATVGTEYRYDADATDADPAGDTLTWSKVSGPDALSIDSSSGLVTWTPTDSDSDPTNVTIRVSDGNGGSDTEDITIAVSGGDPTTPSSGGGGGGGSCFIDSITQ
jgi:hypothetical protein